MLNDPVTITITQNELRTVAFTLRKEERFMSNLIELRRESLDYGAIILSRERLRELILSINAKITK